MEIWTPDPYNSSSLLDGPEENNNMTRVDSNQLKLPPNNPTERVDISYTQEYAKFSNYELKVR